MYSFWRSDICVHLGRSPPICCHWSLSCVSVLVFSFFRFCVCWLHDLRSIFLHDFSSCLFIYLKLRQHCHMWKVYFLTTTDVENENEKRTDFQHSCLKSFSTGDTVNDSHTSVLFLMYIKHRICRAMHIQMYSETFLSWTYSWAWGVCKPNWTEILDFIFVVLVHHNVYR